MHRALRKGLLAAISIGAVMLIAGVALFWLTGLTAQTFGWVAHAPLSNSQLASEAPGRLVLMQPGNWWGLALAVIGALAVSTTLGYALGRRRRQSSGND